VADRYLLLPGYKEGVTHTLVNGIPSLFPTRVTAGFRTAPKISTTRP
jgi:hypothetical protein